MTGWRIRIPHRDRSDPLVTVAEAAGALPTDESAIVRQLVLGEIMGGHATTAGELLDRLEKAAPAERRKVLDAARVKAGLPTTGDVEAMQRFGTQPVAYSAVVGLLLGGGGGPFGLAVFAVPAARLRLDLGAGGVVLLLVQVHDPARLAERKPRRPRVARGAAGLQPGARVGRLVRAEKSRPAKSTEPIQIREFLCG